MEQLPLEVQRTFRLLSEMEQNANNSLAALKSALTNYCDVSRPPEHLFISDETLANGMKRLLAQPQCYPINNVTFLSSVSKHLLESQRHSGDKYSLASTLYETVDRHIQRLDADLTRLENWPNGEAAVGEEEEQGGEDDHDEEEVDHITGTGTVIRIKPPQTSNLGPSSASTTTSTVSTSKKKRKNPTIGAGRKKARKKDVQPQLSKEMLATLDEMPAGIDEPRYCYCNNVAIGEVCSLCDMLLKEADVSHRWWHAITRVGGSIEMCVRKAS